MDRNVNNESESQKITNSEKRKGNKPFESEKVFPEIIAVNRKCKQQ